jgi:hypothetical protein
MQQFRYINRSIDVKFTYQPNQVNSFHVSALTDSATVATTSGVLTLFLAAAAAAIGVGLFRLDDRLNCVDIALPDFCCPLFRKL